jgi:chemotaxis protein MotB
LFELGRADLSPAAYQKLRDLGASLSVSSGIEAIEVVGHTDSKPARSDALYRSNFTLSSMRAGIVAEALLKGGVSAAKVKVSGMGSLRPILPERGADGRLIEENCAKNRRVSIVVHKLVTH